jgi:integrase
VRTVADIRVKKNKSGEVVGYLVRWRENGKQKYRQFRSESEALACKADHEPSAVDLVEAELKRRGEYVDFSGELDRFGRPTDASRAADAEWSVVEYARRMIDAEPDLSAGTREGYRKALRLYFEGTDFGAADVRYVRAEEIIAWWRGLTNGRQDAHRLLSRILNRAIQVGDREDNPLRRAPEVRKPRRRQDIDFDPLTVAQIERLAEAATQGSPQRGFKGRIGEMVRQRDRLLIQVMGFAGLRAGEAGGLRAQDLVKTPDGRCQMRVRQQVIRENDGMRVAPLKTSASRRTITIACSLYEDLIAFAEDFGTAEDGRLFYGPNGELRDHTLTNNMVRRAAKRAGMTGVHSHLLRHSAVSILIHSGVNPRQIQAFVGHADISMTLGVYGHLFDETGTELADAMERLRQQHRNT